MESQVKTESNTPKTIKVDMPFDKQTVLERISWDEAAKVDLMLGRGFLVYQKAFKKQGKEQIKQHHGTHSIKFGSDWEDENSFAEKYRCHCGETIGLMFEGEECPECHTIVTFKDVSLETFGWIRMDQSVGIIEPLYYKALSSAIGKKNFNGIIATGEIERSGLKKDMSAKTAPYQGIGLVEFRERYEEILLFYRRKRRDKMEAIDNLLEEKDKVFASHIPVFSSVLRPVGFSAETLFMTKIDKKYNVVVSKVRTLNRLLKGANLKRKDKYSGALIQLEVPSTLYEIQKKVNELWDLTFSLIDQKNGHIRENLLGGRLNYSARNVIRPDFTLKADEVRLNYHTFAELYKLEIIAHIRKIYQVSYREAFNRWSRGIKDGSLMEVMKMVLKKFKPYVFINRNPTINYGSFLVMRVASIIEDLTDYTMAIPNQVLTVLNADYDGDILNIGSFKSQDFSKAFAKSFNPRLNMFIDRNNGSFNNDMNLHKDQMIGLYDFCNI